VSDDGGHAVVTMTLTTPHCPVAESMPGEVELRVGAVPGVGDVEVNLVWDPPWDPQKMSDEAKLELGDAVMNAETKTPPCAAGRRHADAFRRERASRT
jgi:metal-sulfur cluster biosynthetic enzyme